MIGGRWVRRAAMRCAPAWVKLVVRSWRYPEPECRELDWLVEPGTLAVDIGANRGVYTYRLARRVGRRGSVLAVEPIADLAMRLAATCAMLRLPVRVEHCALSSREGEADLVIPVAPDGTVLSDFAAVDGDVRGPRRVERVALRRLDDVVRERTRRVSFIKCDVEGHELEVFRGADGVLTRDRPTLLVEIEERHGDTPIEERFGFFRAQDYVGFFLDPSGALRELDTFDVRRHQREMSERERVGRSYVNNFIFLPAEGVARALAARTVARRRARA